MIICYCGNNLSFEECCKPYITELKNAPTAEALMRSRYSAYATATIDYLVKTTHLSTRKNHEKAEIESWSKSNKWTKLEVLDATDSTVTFNAYFIDDRNQPQIHHEKSSFILEKENWYYVDGIY
jgi:SEC-C motif-containing protein